MKQTSLLEALPAKALSVQQYIDQFNEQLSGVSVAIEGEMQEMRISRNLWVFFQLKDEDNESVLRCFGVKNKLRNIPLEDGIKVVVYGYAKLHEKYGFSITVERIEPRGEGALLKAYELLKTKLTNEGVFAEERKRPIPRIPERVALIASEESAAYSDFVKVLNARRGGLTIDVLHSGVQGKSAIPQLVQALDYASSQHDTYDAVVMTRGGGSIEDLQAFNAEDVVRAVYRSKVPVIVAVGHERDETLAEYAADLRASTPSNAAELLSETSAALVGELEHTVHHMYHVIGLQQSRHTEHLQRAVRTATVFFQQQQQHAANSIQRMSQAYSRITAEVERQQTLTAQSVNVIQKMIQYTLQGQHERQQALRQMLNIVDPNAALRRGYAVMRDKDSGGIMRSVRDIRAKQEVQVQLADGTVHATTTSVEQSS